MDKKFFQLTFYNILANLTVPLTGLADTAILGQLETHTFLAGVALSNVLFDYLFWGFSFLRMSTTGLTAQAEGNRNITESFQILIRSLVLASFVGFLLLFLKYFIGEIGFSFLQGEEEVKASGYDYFHSRIWSAPGTLCNFVLMGWFLGRSKSGIVLAATILANVSNFLLNIWFVLYLNWNAAGAGYATTISQYLMLLFFLIPLAKERIRFREVYDKIRIFSLSGFQSLLSLNSDILVRTLLLITTFSLFRNYSSGLGSPVLAANAILHQLILVGAFWIDGAAVATETIAGTLKGNRDFEGLKRILKLGIISGFAISLIFCFLFLGFSERMFAVFSKSKQVAVLAQEYGYWIIPVLLLGSTAFIFDGFFLGMSEGKTLRNCMIVSSIVFFLPIAYWGKLEASNHILWLSLATYMFGRTLTLGVIAYKKFFLRKMFN
ncbi:MATE family efflux transporter [Leptospira semungkisensis]|uniref:MATE family efflux transporter n=1 Tax=Leptospira semungkisensis TaxID=2484985 RepID=A0A4R9G6B1_9LEPT|nr:MATE family efflux transporter [Leptospira semungkisensis]TGK07112.1 MATE family efflux transporter [Leptospira semungkisensis]